jgi:putative peptide maturation system protein
MTNDQNGDAMDAMNTMLALLRKGAAERLTPSQMQLRLAALRERDPSLVAELVWECEPHGGTYHYDALLGDAAGTVSLAFCADDAVPWPLRGVRRWADGDLVRVNEKLMRVHDVIALIDFIWDQEPLVMTIVDACLLREAVDAERIVPTDEELQAAFDLFRRRRGLFDAEETTAWMERNGYTLQHLEHYMHDEARAQALRKRVTTDRVDRFLAERARDIDLALLAYLDFDSREAAVASIELLRSGQQDFFSLITERAALMRTAGRAGELPCTRSVLRFDLDVDQQEAVFSAAPGAIVGPFAIRRGFRVYRVLGVSAAGQDDDARGRAERVLFDEWLAERRRNARIEWQWGREAGA